MSTTSVHHAGVWWGGEDLVDGLDEDADTRQPDERRNNERGERLGLAVPVGVVAVGGFGTDVEAAPDHDRSHDVCDRFDRIGDQRVAVPDDAGQELEHGQREVHTDADECNALGARGGHAREGSGRKEGSGEVAG